MLRQYSTIGKTFEKTFANQESFKEAMIAAELYKTSKTISRVFTAKL